jgi:hypothetical protein
MKRINPERTISGRTDRTLYTKSAVHEAMEKFILIYFSSNVLDRQVIDF